MNDFFIKFSGDNLLFTHIISIKFYEKKITRLNFKLDRIESKLDRKVIDKVLKIYK